MKGKKIPWTGSQGEHDDPVILSQFLILVVFRFSVRRQQSPGANIPRQGHGIFDRHKVNLFNLHTKRYISTSKLHKQRREVIVYK